MGCEYMGVNTAARHNIWESIRQSGTRDVDKKHEIRSRWDQDK